MKTQQGFKEQVIFHAAICTAIIALITIVAAFSSNVHLGFFGYIALFIVGSIFTTIGVVIGDVFRRAAMPDAYLTTGFSDSIKKRIFWSVGPQAIGWFIGTIATNGFMQNYLGYDMQNGRPRQATTVDVNKELAKAIAEAEPVPVKSAPVPQIASHDIQPALPAPGSFPSIESGSCVVGLSRQTPQGLEFERPIPVFPERNTATQIGTLKTFSSFFTEGQDRVTGRVHLVYAPGFSGDEPKAGQALGWVNAADIVQQDLRNCQ